MMMKRTLWLAVVLGWVGFGTVRLEAAAKAGDKTIQLFNGKDLSKFYTFLRDRGRDNDPQKVFTVVDGMIRISGEEWGCLTTHEEYANYRLIAEYKWGKMTFRPRETRARDSGILVHSVGKDGGYGGVWIFGIEVQMIEGGTGDLLVVGDQSERYMLTCPVGPAKQGSCWVFQDEGKPATINGGRINWWGRDPGWKDVKDFRGAKDVEKPIGQWNRLEVIVQGQTIRILLNGVLVNRCIDVQPRKGRIQIQSEGAEVFFRKFDLVPIEQ